MRRGPDGADSRDDAASQDHDRLGRLMANAVERLRAGETPTAGEIARQIPEHEKDVRAALATLKCLEAAGAKHRNSPEGLESGVESLGDHLNRLPLLTQRVIYLRDFKKLPWKEIANVLGRQEKELRKVYARTVKELVEGQSSDRE